MTCFDMTHYAATKLQVGYIRLTDQKPKPGNFTKSEYPKASCRRLPYESATTRHKSQKCNNKCHNKISLQNVTTKFHKKLLQPFRAK